MSRAILSPLASRDLEHIYEFISQQSPSGAVGVISSIQGALTLLAEWPRLGRERPEIALRCRSYTIKGHVIYYRPHAQGIEVGRILHGARDPRIVRF